VLNKLKELVSMDKGNLIPSELKNDKRMVMAPIVHVAKGAPTVKIISSRTVKRDTKWFMIGYTRSEGEMMMLLGMTNEEEADKLIEEYKEHGTITKEIRYGASSEVLRPIDVCKLSCSEGYFREQFIKEVDKSSHDAVVIISAVKFDKELNGL
jgi:hypothetical protein